MMRRFTYPASFAADRSGRILVNFPDLPEAVTDGADPREALLEATDCLAEAIAGRIRRAEVIPAPGRPRGRHYVRITLPTRIGAKAALYLAMRAAKLSNSVMARRLGCDEKEVRRLLDPRHASKITRIEEALAVLHQRLEIGMVDVDRPPTRPARSPDPRRAVR